MRFREIWKRKQEKWSISCSSMIKCIISSRHPKILPWFSWFSKKISKKRNKSITVYWNNQFFLLNVFWDQHINGANEAPSMCVRFFFEVFSSAISPPKFWRQLPTPPFLNCLILNCFFSIDYIQKTIILKSDILPRQDWRKFLNHTIGIFPPNTLSFEG